MSFTYKLKRLLVVMSKGKRKKKEARKFKLAAQKALRSSHKAVKVVRVAEGTLEEKPVGELLKASHRWAPERAPIYIHNKDPEIPDPAVQIEDLKLCLVDGKLIFRMWDRFQGYHELTWEVKGEDKDILEYVIKGR